MNRKVVIAVCIAFLGITTRADAQPKPTVTAKFIRTKKISETEMRGKVRITAALPGLATNTFETAEFTVKKLQIVRPPLPKSGVFSFNVSCEWKNNSVTTKVSVTAGTVTVSKTDVFKVE